MTATTNAAEVQLAEILQRVEATLAGQATSAAQQAAATDARFAQGDSTWKSAIVAFEQKVADALSPMTTDPVKSIVGRVEGGPESRQWRCRWRPTSESGREVCERLVGRCAQGPRQNADNCKMEARGRSTRHRSDRGLQLGGSSRCTSPSTSTRGDPAARRSASAVAITARIPNRVGRVGQTWLRTMVI